MSTANHEPDLAGTAAARYVEAGSPGSQSPARPKQPFLRRGIGMQKKVALGRQRRHAPPPQVEFSPVNFHHFPAQAEKQPKRRMKQPNAACISPAGSSDEGWQPTVQRRPGSLRVTAAANLTGRDAARGTAPSTDSASTQKLIMRGRTPPPLPKRTVGNSRTGVKGAAAKSSGQGFSAANGTVNAELKQLLHQPQSEQQSHTSDLSSISLPDLPNISTNPIFSERGSDAGSWQGTPRYPSEAAVPNGYHMPLLQSAMADMVDSSMLQAHTHGAQPTKPAAMHTLFQAHVVVDSSDIQEADELAEFQAFEQHFNHEEPKHSLKHNAVQQSPVQSTLSASTSQPQSSGYAELHHPQPPAADRFVGFHPSVQQSGAVLAADGHVSKHQAGTEGQLQMPNGHHLLRGESGGSGVDSPSASSIQQLQLLADMAASSPVTSPAATKQLSQPSKPISMPPNGVLHPVHPSHHSHQRALSPLSGSMSPAPQPQANGTLPSPAVHSRPQEHIRQSQQVTSERYRGMQRPATPPVQPSPALAQGEGMGGEEARGSTPRRGGEAPQLQRERRQVQLLKEQLKQALARLEAERSAYAQQQTERVAVWEGQREEEEKRLKRERRVLDQQSKALLKLPNRKERSEVEALEAVLAEERRAQKGKDARHKLTVERLRRQILELQEKQAELQEEVKWYEAQRLAHWEAPATPDRAAHPAQAVSGTTARSTTPGSARSRASPASQAPPASSRRQTAAAAAPAAAAQQLLEQRCEGDAPQHSWDAAAAAAAQAVHAASQWEAGADSCTAPAHDELGDGNAIELQMAGKPQQPLAGEAAWAGSPLRQAPEWPAFVEPDRATGPAEQKTSSASMYATRGAPPAQAAVAAQQPASSTAGSMQHGSLHGHYLQPDHCEMHEPPPTSFVGHNWQGAATMASTSELSNQQNRQQPNVLYGQLRDRYHLYNSTGGVSSSAMLRQSLLNRPDMDSTGVAPAAVWGGRASGRRPAADDGFTSPVLLLQAAPDAHTFSKPVERADVGAGPDAASPDVHAPGVAASTAESNALSEPALPHERDQGLATPGPASLMQEICCGDGKREQIYSDGRRVVHFANGAIKEQLPDGCSTVLYSNQDIKTSFPDGRVEYFYAEVDTWHTTHPDGIEVYYFASGQTEAHHPDGLKEILFPDGLPRRVLPDGTEQQVDAAQLSAPVLQLRPTAGLSAEMQ